MMNERIKKLAEQAGMVYHCEHQYDGFNEQKFAELIVRECMRMCEVAQVGYLTHGLTLQGEGCQGAKRYIADWFEVEE